MLEILGKAKILPSTLLVVHDSELIQWLKDESFAVGVNNSTRHYLVLTTNELDN